MLWRLDLGEMKIGRIPQFLYEDVFNKHPVKNCDAAKEDARGFKANFERVYQYLQERCQHHLHKLVDGKRVVTNACRAKSKPQECKHGVH